MLPRYKFGIFKDVLEHIEEDKVRDFILSFDIETIFIIVPIGNGEKYYIPAQELDATHKIRRPLLWWIELVETCGFKVINSTTRIDGMKDHWSAYRNGHGFIVGRKRKRR